MKRLLCMLIVVVLVSSAQAGLLYEISDYSALNQRTGGVANVTVGAWFITGPEGVTINALGFIDLNDTEPTTGAVGDGLALAHTVKLWKQAALVAEVVVPAGTAATLVDAFRMVELPEEMTLAANTAYTVSTSISYDATKDFWLNDNVDPFAAPTEFVGANPAADNWRSRWANDGDELRPWRTNRNEVFYGIVNVQAVPEPATLTLLGLGVLAFRRRQ